MALLKRITIIGTSVALRTRPVANQSTAKLTYGKRLENILNINSHADELWELTNLAFSRAMVSEILYMKDQIVRTEPDLLIVNLGAVDAPTREIPRWYSDVIFQRKYQTFYTFLNYIYINLIKQLLRRPLVFLRGKRPWTKASKFHHEMQELLDFLLKETPAKIVLMGINKGNKRIETELPGTLNNYYNYNEILRKIANERNLTFIDFSDLVPEKYFPDGVHYNEDGHKYVANKLHSLIQLH